MNWTLYLLSMILAAMLGAYAAKVIDKPVMLPIENLDSRR